MASHRNHPLHVERGRAGLRLRGAGLSLDAYDPDTAAFLSHAALRWRGRMGRVITSERTALLLGARQGALLGSPLHQPFALGPLTLELLPAGFALDAAALLVRRGEQQLIYTWAVGAGLPPCAEPAEARRCDVLVLGTVHGVPARGSRAAVQARLSEIANWVRGTLAAGGRPLLVCEPLGAAAPLAAWLVGQGLVVRAHRAVHRVLSRLRAAGVLEMPVIRFDGTLPPEQVLLWPRGTPLPRPDAGAEVQGLLVSPDGASAEAIGRAGCAAGRALSGLADRQGWTNFVTRCEPERVVLPEAPPEWMAAALDRLGCGVRVLGRASQLSLF